MIGIGGGSVGIVKTHILIMLVAAATLACTNQARADVAPSPPAASTSVDLTPILVWTIIAAITFIVLLRRGVFSTKSLTEAPRRDSAPLSPIVWIALGMGAYLLLVLGGGTGILLAIAAGMHPISMPAQSVSMWGGYGAVLIALAILLFQKKQLFRKAGLFAQRRDLLIGAGAYLLAFPFVTLVLLIAGLIATQLRGHTESPITHELLAQLVQSPRTLAWFAIVVGVTIAAPIVEEVIYRGCLQTAILRATRSPAIAIVASAILFAGAHVSSVRPEALAGLFVLALAFGLTFERTGRLGASIVMHVLFNIVNLAQAIVFT